MRRLVGTLPWLVVLAGLLFPSVAPPEWLFAAPGRHADRTRARLVRHLAERHGLLCALTFDEPAPGEFLSGAAVLYSGTVASPGRHGQARKFDGRERTQIETPIKWNRLGSAFTLSFWVKMPRGRSDQCIWYRADRDVQVGFHLEAGRMTFDLPGATGRQFVAYSFAGYDRFVHLAVTVDAAEGRMVLYENGRNMAESRFDYVGMPQVNMAFGKPMWYATRNPFRGWIDEATIWSRVLPEDEIRRLAGARRGVLWTHGGHERYLLWRLADAWTGLARAAAGASDLPAALAPRGARDRQAIGRLPEVRLVLSGKVRRDLIAAHHRSRKSGRRTQAGARPRPAHVAFAGKVHPAWIRLAGDDMEYADGSRAGYEVELPAGAQVLGARRLLLRPPENGDWLFPLVDSRIRNLLGLPTVSNGLCRLRINGLAGGVYIFSNHDRGGFLPGDARDASMDRNRRMSHWTRLFYQFRRRGWAPAASPPAWPLALTEIEAAYDAVVAEWGGCLRGDLQNPTSRKETGWRLRQGRARIASLWPPAEPERSLAGRMTDCLNEFMVLGSNASPDRLVAPLDLELTALKNRGLEIQWRSSNPAILGHDGQVHRPAAGGPVAVQLIARIDAGRESFEKKLIFRVMPQQIALPALFLNVRRALDKTRRVDAVVEICEAGEDFPARVVFATQGSRGGIEHRGNTSYSNDKKLFSLKTDEPHRLLDDSARQVLLAVNSEQDPSFVRNRLAYDLFRSWGTVEAPRVAPRTRHAEVFLNGRYHGLFELCTRVDETLLDESLPPGAGEPLEPRWIVYRHEAVFPRIPYMRARRPGEHAGDFSGPYRDLCQFLARPTNPAWEAELARRVDLRNLADFQLLLNLFQNINGYPFHFPMHEALVHDNATEMFFHVPWDFEAKVAMGSWQWRQNNLMARLERESPGYAARLAARWRELRESGLVTPEALDARIDALAEALRDYADWDYRRWGYEAGPGFEWQIENLKVFMRESIARMDRQLG